MSVVGGEVESVLAGVPAARMPRHIAIIMDGNGRWARQRGFPRIFGHRNGAATVRRVVTECGRLGVKVVTLYSFSLENWKRPRDEVEALMELAVTYLGGERDELVREGVRLRVIGSREGLPARVVEAIEAVERATAGCEKATLCLAINYSGRAEIVEAVRSLARDAAAGRVQAEAIDEAMVASRLWTAGLGELAEPDLLIRTAGESRVSNFLLWQIGYSEIHVTDVLWPDFVEEDLHRAIRDFAGRERRFGAVGA
ncbi:MAG: isoprenyl transferase [Phycisphaerales bacterium]